MRHNNYRFFLFLIVLCLGFSIPAIGGWGEGVAAYDKKDYATALQEFRPLAELGDSSAQFALGVMHNYGYGVSKDYAQAVKWYRKAAEQGHATAQNNLGFRYDNGQGVLQDFKQAEQ